MSLLLAGLGLMVVSGLLALMAGRASSLACGLGAGGAVLGSVLGLFPAFGVLVKGGRVQASWPWDVPYGSFSLELDPLSAFFLLIVLGMTALTAIYAAEYLQAFRDRKLLGVPWFFFNLMAASMALVAIARNGLLFLVAWEVMSLASYFLVTFDDERAEVREAGRTYLIATHLGTAFLFVLFILLGRSTGSLEFADFAGHISPRMANLLFVLAVVGFGTKAGFMPFHVWSPEAYPVAPSFVSALMSGAMSKLGIYGLVRTLTFMPEVPLEWAWLLIAIGVVSGVYGILTGLAQYDMKRLLAYSSIENIGIIALGLGLGLLGMSTGRPELAVLGFSGALLHVANHALFKGLLFLGAGAVIQATGTRDLDRLGGLAKRMPRLAIAFFIGCLGIVGLPPLNGFVSEFLIYSGAFVGEVRLEIGPSVVTLIVMIAALALIGGLAMIAFTNLFGMAFLGEPRSAQAATAKAPGALMSVPITILAAGCVLVGLCSMRIVPMLLPLVVEITHWDIVELEPIARAAVAPLSAVTIASSCLIVVALALTVLRYGLLSIRQVTQSGTWGCGYTAPTARMQYTASSYVQPSIEFFAPLLLTSTSVTRAEGLFPQAAAVATATPDMSKQMLYRPLFGTVGRVLSRLRWLQHGRVHIYILYVGVTIVALLTWYVGSIVDNAVTP
jgi:hydrogenase-4 component B